MKEMTAALIIEDRKLLVVHNIKHGLRIEPPGGKKEDGETLEDCVIREVREELRIDIKILELFGVYKTNSPEGNFRVSMYLSKISGGAPEIQETNKHSKFEWCDYSSLENYKQQNYLVRNLCEALPKLRSLDYI